MEQLKIDIVATTSKFDQQVRASGRMIQNFTDMIRRSGGSIDEVTKKFDSDATLIVRSMGNMKISATDTRGAFKQLNTALQELRILYNNLSKEERSSAFGAATAKSIQELQVRVKGLKTDLQSLDAGKNNGGNDLMNSVFGGNMKSYFTVRAIYGAIDLLKRGITGAVETIAEFEQANANLAAVLGKTNDEISDLTENAKRLGATTVWTAGQITELQTTLARRGIGQADILNMTEGISQLATATGINLAQAAEIAGSAMQAFGMQSTEMNDIAATLGVSTTKSALTMEKLHTSLAYVAPAAKAAGFNMRETVAMLGVLADSGLPATTAGVAVRNILIDLSRSSSKLATAIGHPVRNLDELIEALGELEEKGGNNLEYISSLVEKRVVPGFTTLMNNTEKMAELRDSITDVRGELQEMADKQIDTLHGSVVLLKSAWDGLMLSFSEGSSAIKTVVDMLTKVVNKLTEIRVLSAGVDKASSFFQKGADRDRATEILNGYRANGVSEEQLPGIIEKEIATLKEQADVLEKEFEKASKRIHLGYFTPAADAVRALIKKNKVEDLAALQDQIATLELVLQLNKPAETETTTVGTGGTGDGEDYGRVPSGRY